MQIRTNVLIVYIILTVASAVAYLMPTVWAILSLFTLGLLALVPNIWLYLTLLLPIALLRSNGPISLLLKAASIVLMIYVGFGVPKERNKHIDAAVASLTKNDFKRPATLRPKHLKFIVRASWKSEDKYKEPILETSECDRLCQRLLLNGDVETVTMEATDNYLKKSVSIVTYHMEKLARCPDAFSKIDRAIIDIVLQAVEGNCLISSINQDMETGLQFETDWNVELDKKIFPAGSELPRAWRFLVSEKINHKLTPIVQLTTVRYSRPGDLLTVSPYGGLFTTVSGWQTSGTSTSINGFTTAEFIETEYKISAIPPAKSVDDKHPMDLTGFNRIYLKQEIVEKLLNDPNPEAFNQDVNLAITSWISNLIYKAESRSLTASESALILQIAQDARISDLTLAIRGLERLMDTHVEASKIIVARLCDPGKPLVKWSTQPMIMLLKRHSSLPRIEQSIEGPEQLNEFRTTYCKQ